MAAHTTEWLGMKCPGLWAGTKTLVEIQFHDDDVKEQEPILKERQ